MQTTIIDSPHEKSIKFLQDVCKMDGIEMLIPTQYTTLLCVFEDVQAVTTRWLLAAQSAYSVKNRGRQQL